MAIPRPIVARTEITSIHAVGDALIAKRYISSFVVNEKTKHYKAVWTKKGRKFASEFVDIALLASNIQLGSQFLDEAMSEVLWSVVQDKPK